MAKSSAKQGDVPDDGIVMDSDALDQDAQEAEVQDRTGETYIRYVGTSTVREITREQWKSIGVDAPTVRWRPANSWTLNANILPEQALQHVRDMEPELLFVGGDHELKGHAAQEVPDE